MAVVFQKSVGLLLLAVWLILYGLTGLSRSRYRPR